MKKTSVAIAVALAGVIGVAQASPKDNTWYTGAKLGWSQYHDTGLYGNLFSVGSVSNNQVAAGAFGGYQANPYLGFEMGYDWLGRMTYKGSTGNGAFKAQGVQLAAKLGYPITNNLDIYARLGGLIWRADANASINKKSYSANDKGVSPLFAGGIEWAITPAIATRLEYQWVSNIGDANTVHVRPDNGLLSLGVSYRFGQHEAPVLAPAPQPAPEPAPAPVLQTKHFTLKSDVLFNFNKATLKVQGQQALDKLYGDLSDINPGAGSVTVQGYTDRLGSDSYNLKLSARRAETVQNYLIQKGVPAGTISAIGVGKADPVTGHQCDGIKNRGELIACLAPDRRVEIEVKAEKAVMVTPSENE